MRVQPGMRLGPYEVLSLGGAGGMGEVYRARDTRLNRIVAVKVIGVGFGDDPEIRRRFDEEGRVAAQLDHPRICAVYDVGHDNGVDYLVMEFLEGKTLADRLRGEPLDFRELLGYAIEIASGLGYAHHRGVVHCDLKPGNVVLTRSGVKIVDFGLATMRQVIRRGGLDMAALKTVPLSPATPNAITGTAQYLPPERLYGQEADHRGDIFAFGAILYEMATGRRAFDAANSSALVTSILTAEPPEIPAASAASRLDWIVRACIKKDPSERWDSMRDVEAVLRDVARQTRADRTARSPARRTVAIAALTIAAALVGVGAITLYSVESRLARTAALEPIAVVVPPPAGPGFTPTEGSKQSPQLAVSPDGEKLAFVAAAEDGTPQIWVRQLDSPVPRPVPGTARATYPFWSASSRSLGFFADTHLKRVDLDGAPPRTLAPAPNGRGGSWNSEDVILLAPNAESGIFSISAAGGTPRPVTSTIDGETSHRWPTFLPDGRHFLYFARRADESQVIVRGSLDDATHSEITHSTVGAVFMPPDQLLYVSDNVLLAAPFDPTTGRLRGDPAPVVDQIATSSNFYGAFSASANGVLAYATTASISELVWMSRDGRRLGLVAGHGSYVDFKLSPDDRYLAVAEVDAHADRPDVHVIDTVRGTDIRLTTSPATDASPIWSPDGSRIVFRSNRDRVHDLFIRPAHDSGDDQPFVKTSSAKYPTDWSRSGQLIVYHANDARTRYDVWAAPAGRPDQRRALVQTEFDEMQGQISPDGRWLAYTSNRSSRFEVYIQSLDGSGRTEQISIDGGSGARWRADGRELFYVGRDGMLMAVAMKGGATLDAGKPKRLFPLSGVSVQPPFLSAYDVDTLGERFLVRVPLQELETLPLNVVVHWFGRGQGLVGARAK